MIESGGRHVKKRIPSRMMIKPIQKLGIAMHTVARTLATASSQEFRRTALKSPTGMPKSHEIMSASTAISALIGARRRITWLIDSLVQNDVPKSPWSTEPTQARYWTGYG